MLYLNVTYTMPKENRDAFVSELKELKIEELTRQERGNHAYDFSVPISSETQVFLREIWEDDALEEHKTSANIKKLGAMKGKYNIETTITISKFDE